jgi:hypothetical protein
MTYWNIQDDFYVDKPILRSAENIVAIQAVAISDVDVSFNEKGKKAVPAGMWLSKVNGLGRFLPRAKVTTAAPIGSTQIAVNLQQVFKIGDSLKYLEEKAVLTLGGTYVIGNNIYFLFDNGSLAYSVTDTTPANVAIGLAAYINASTQLEVRAVAVGSTVELYSVRGGSISLSTNSAAGTVVVTTPYTAAGYIGTITAINYATSTLMVSAPTTQALAVGALIGSPVDEIVGFHETSVDFSYRPHVMLRAISGANGVYTQAFPYLDSEIKARFPKITFA